MQIVNVWRCKLVPPDSVGRGYSKKKFFFLCFFSFSLLFRDFLENKNWRICWICICYCLPRETFLFFFVTCGSAQLLAVYIYLYCLKKGNRWAFYISGNAFFLSLFFSEGMELISITYLQNIQLVSCLIENLKQVVHWTVCRRLTLSYFAFWLIFIWPYWLHSHCNMQWMALFKFTCRQQYKTRAARHPWK